ncbi:hypothetical protein O181_029880 [Austropuccinia psidii MF-1]|uniref:Uncharacterized protein n=1 Tax=Austropuccinia psidii MF-1 TaxID=1389203 RepID=A0A9Q3H5M6_9BASI|nr:hypothetical protein [Austropuccinia psidii MF-1]
MLLLVLLRLFLLILNIFYLSFIHARYIEDLRFLDHQNEVGSAHQDNNLWSTVPNIDTLPQHKKIQNQQNLAPQESSPIAWNSPFDSEFNWAWDVHSLFEIPEANSLSNSYRSSIVTETEATSSSLRLSHPYFGLQDNDLSYLREENSLNQFYVNSIMEETEVNLWNFPLDYHFNVGGNENELSHFSESNPSNWWPTSGLNLDKSYSNQFFGQPPRVFPGEDQPNLELYEPLADLDYENRMTHSSKDQGKEVTQAVELNKEINHPTVEPAFGQHRKTHSNSTPDTCFKLENINNSRQLVLCRLYRLVGDDKVERFRGELEAFLQNIQKEYFEKSENETTMTPDAFYQRLSFIMKASLLQTELYARLYQGVNPKDQEALGTLQKKAFNFMKDYWSFVLIKNGNVENEGREHEETLFMTESLEETKKTFESHGGNDFKAQTTSWHGLEAYMNVQWRVELKRAYKYSINDEVLSLGPQYGIDTSQFLKNKALNLAGPNNGRVMEKDKLNSDQLLQHQCQGSNLLTNEGDFIKMPQQGTRYLVHSRFKSLGEAALKECNFTLKTLLKNILKRYEEILGIFEGRKKKSMLDRILYVMKASFLQVRTYSSLNNRGKLQGTDMSDVEERAFCLLNNFCELVLFNTCDPKSEYYKREAEMKEDNSLKQARLKLSCRGGNEQHAETASWHATTFCLRWIWEEDLEPRQKTQIIDAIMSQQQTTDLLNPFNFGQKEITETAVSVSAQMVKKKYRSRVSIQFYCEKLGGAALSDCEPSLADFLNTILERYDDWLGSIKKRKKESIIARASYFMKASFLRIQFYDSLELGGPSRTGDDGDFKEKTFRLLKNFCYMALLARGNPNVEPSATETISKKDGALEAARSKLGAIGANDENAETASWHATEFCVRSFWQKDLKQRQKSQINKAIMFWGKKNS